MKLDKRMIIIGAITFLVTILVIVTMCLSSSRTKSVNKFMNNITAFLVEQLSKENISGSAEFDLNVRSSERDGKTIIEKSKTQANYEINLKEGYSNIGLSGKYNDKTLNTNIHFAETNMYITLKDVYNKNISYNNIEMVKYLTNAKDTRNLIKIFMDEINNLTKNKNYEFETIKNKKEKTKKITLDISEENNSKLREKLINNLIKNKKFIKSLSKLEKFPEETIKEKMKNEYANEYKLVVYTKKGSKDFIKTEIKINEIDIKINKKNNKYYFEYYIRDGLEYSGYVEIDNDKINKINIKNNLEHYEINIKLEKYDINYNTELTKENNLLLEGTIPNTELTEEIKNQILKNDVIYEINDNYKNRHPEQIEEEILKIDEPEPEPEWVPSEKDLYGPVINGVG